MIFPVQFEAVETDHVLQVHQDHHQRVQLVSQPEVRKTDTMKWSRYHSKLKERKGQRGGFLFSLVFVCIKVTLFFLKLF